MSMQQFVARVRNTAVKAGGAYFPYSQCLEPTATLIKMMPSTAGGICQALAAKWIAEHANEGSLWNWLCTAGTSNVKQGQIANLMVNFNESVTTDKGSGAFNTTVKRSKSQTKMAWQDVVTEKYLAQYGVIRRGMARARMNNSMQMNGGGGTNLGVGLASLLEPAKWNGQGFYLLISIMGDGGHALAAYVGRDDICFFDPNFGDFYFDTRAKFKNFMKDFWKESGYGKDFDSFYLLDFGRRVN